jgi:2-oxo-4-hydroxy-4-carboxy--5-ureidoimidazoline (OHCU) decarboxylase
MSIGNFFFKQLLKSKMKDVPAAEQEKIFSILEKNPDFFQKIALKVQSKVKNGQDQTSAVMEVINEHKDELQKVLGNQQ